MGGQRQIYIPPPSAGDNKPKLNLTGVLYSSRHQVVCTCVQRRPGSGAGRWGCAASSDTCSSTTSPGLSAAPAACLHTIHHNQGVYAILSTKGIITSKTRRVLSEMKAIMSLPVCHWMESIFFCRVWWNRNLELSQKVMNTQCATWERGFIFDLDLEQTLVKHRHCTSCDHS